MLAAGSDPPAASADVAGAAIVAAKSSGSSSAAKVSGAARLVARRRDYSGRSENQPGDRASGGIAEYLLGMARVRVLVGFVVLAGALGFSCSSDDAGVAGGTGAVTGTGASSGSGAGEAAAAAAAAVVASVAAPKAPSRISQRSRRSRRHCPRICRASSPRRGKAAAARARANHPPARWCRRTGRRSVSSGRRPPIKTCSNCGCT